MQTLWDTTMDSLVVLEPIFAGLVIIALLVFVGDRGSKLALSRNSPCLAVLCIFAFALGAGLATWTLIMRPLSELNGAAFSPGYSLILIYWAFWLLIGVIISAKKLIYENAKLPGQYFK